MNLIFGTNIVFLLLVFYSHVGFVETFFDQSHFKYNEYVTIYWTSGGDGGKWSNRKSLKVSKIRLLIVMAFWNCHLPPLYLPTVVIYFISTTSGGEYVFSTIKLLLAGYWQTKLVLQLVLNLTVVNVKTWSFLTSEHVL